MSLPSERVRWLVRHGESVANAGGVTDDPAAIPLSPVGEAQARVLVGRLPRVPDLIVQSPFLRTRQTAGPVMAHYPDVPVAVWAVQEFTYLAPARCAGTTAAVRRPMVEAYWARCDPDFVDGEGAESFSAMVARVRVLRARLEELAVPFILVFGHGQFFQVLRMMEAMPGAGDRALMARFPEWNRVGPIRNAEVVVVEC